MMIDDSYESHLFLVDRGMFMMKLMMMMMKLMMRPLMMMMLTMVDDAGDDS